MNDPLIPRKCRVLATRANGPGVFTLELEAPAGYGRFEAGQFNMLYIPGAGEAAISISGDPERPRTLVHTIRAVGSVTRLLQKRRADEQIGLRGPFGQGWPLPRAAGRDLVIIAGGIGLAPLRPVLYAAIARRTLYSSISLLYGARSPQDILYGEQLLEWKRDRGLVLFVSVDNFSPGWQGDVGVITECIPRVHVDPERVTAMVCGPETMIRFSVAKLLAQGVSREDIFVSLERNMKCAVGFCGHCQLGPHFICRHGPVFPYDAVEPYMMTGEF